MDWTKREEWILSTLAKHEDIRSDFFDLGFRVVTCNEWLALAKKLRSIPVNPANPGEGLFGFYAPAQAIARIQIVVCDVLRWLEDDVFLYIISDGEYEIHRKYEVK